MGNEKIDVAGFSFSREEILDRMTDKLLEQLPKGWGSDEDDREVLVDRVLMKIRSNVHEAIDTAAEKFAQETMGPKLGEVIREWMFTQTSKFGEKKGEPLTATEYVHKLLNDYVSAHVNSEGKTIERSDYCYDKSQTRLSREIGRYFASDMDAALKSVVAQGAALMGKEIKETLSQSIERMVKSVKVTVSA